MDRARAQRLLWVEPLRQLLRLDRGGHSATRSWCMCCAKRPVLSIALRRTGLSCCIRWRLRRSGECQAKSDRCRRLVSRRPCPWADVEIGHLVIAKPIDVILLEPVAVRCGKIFLREHLTEIGLRPE